MKRPRLSVGLTGAMGAGKSTVLALFKELGWKTLSADQVVSRIYRAHGLTKADLRAKYGSSPAGLKKLERWVHPRVEAAVLEFLQKSNRKFCMIEIPLLFEAGYEKFFDLSLGVSRPYTDRLQKIRERGMPLKVWRAMEKRQWSSKQKLESSDLVVLNHGSPGDLKKTVRALERALRDL